MRLHPVPAACGLLVLSLCAPAYGVNCYQIWDASETLLYQSVYPPFDLARPAFDREMANLRAQRRTFIFFDTLNCSITGSSLTGPQSRAASADPASLLDIRAQPDYSRGSSGGMLSPTPGSIGAGAPASAPPASAGTRPSGASAGMSVGASSPAGRY